MTGEHQDQEVSRLAVLVRAAQNGDEKALGEIIDRTQRRLLKFAYLLTGKTETAEDLCQDTYLKAFDAISSLKEPEKLISWLYRILKNLSIDRFRLASNQNERPSEELDLVMDPSSTNTDREKIIEVRELIQNLDSGDRFLLLTVHLEGYSYREAGEMVGLTEDAVRLRLHRARKFLLEKLAKDETNPIPHPSKA